MKMLKKHNEVQSQKIASFINNKINKTPLLKAYVEKAKSVYNAEQIIRKVYEDDLNKFKLKNQINSNNIEEDIIIASIEEESIDDMIASIKEKYTK